MVQCVVVDLAGGEAVALHCAPRCTLDPLPVREFNLIACLLVQSSWKNSLPEPDRRESSVRQASRHCRLFSGLAHWATETDRNSVE